MIFETKDLYVDFVEKADIKDIVEVYNSNNIFLAHHMDIHKVTYEWIDAELASMKDMGFISCKIVERCSDKIVGTIDFKIAEETYLSLLIMHDAYKNKGYGNLTYKALEDYVKSQKSSSIRIDVVIGYDDRVLEFWAKNGFHKFKDIELNWTGKILPAVVMKKPL